MIMYADHITESMQRTIDETSRRRSIQMKYNEDHNIKPQQIKKEIKQTLSKEKAPTARPTITYKPYVESEEPAFAADPIIIKMTKEQLEKCIERTTSLMKEAAEQLDFIQAAQYRDEVIRLQKELEEK